MAEVASRARWLGLALVAGLTTGLGCRADEPDAFALPALRACYSGVSAHQSIARYAVEHGLFARHGLDVELVRIESGTTATTALLAGDVEVCVVSAPAPVSAIVAGEDLRIVAGIIDGFLYTLVARRGISAAHELRGGIVAVSELGSSSDAAVRAALVRLGLDPERDVTIVAAGPAGARLQALESGQVAATVVTPPNHLEARRLGFVELLGMEELAGAYQHTAVATSASLIAQRPEALRSFLGGLNEAIWRMRHDREGTYRTVASEMGLDLVDDAELLADAFESTLGRYVQFPTDPSPAGIQAVLHQLAFVNPKAREFTPRDVIDPEPMETLRATGLFERLASD